MKNPKAVLDLHQKLQTGTYPFETALGKGFVGKVAELAKKYGGVKDVSSKTVQGGKEAVGKGGHGRKGKAAGRMINFPWKTLIKICNGRLPLS